MIFSLIEFLPSHLLRGYPFDATTFLVKTVGGCTYWFTSALVVVELVLLLLFISRRRSVWLYFAASCLIYAFGQYLVSHGYSLFDWYQSFPWQYKHGMLAMIFVALGGLYWKYETTINRYVNGYVIAVIAAAYTALLLICPQFFKVLVSMLNVNVAGIVLSLMATIILIDLCKRLPMLRALNYIGQNTIGFYFMSGALPIVLSMVLHRYQPESTFAGFAVVFFGSLAIAYGAVFLMNRYAPWLFDLRQLKKHSKTNI